MEVTFASKSPTQNRIGPMRMESGKKIYLGPKGYTTTDKEEIKGLLSHPFYGNRYEMISNPKLVDAYLGNDDEPEYITEEFFDGLSQEAVIEIGEVMNSNNTFPSLIKAELKSKPVTDAVMMIAMEDKAEDTDQDEAQDTPEAKKTKKVEKKTATKKEAPSKKKKTSKKSKS